MGKAGRVGGGLVGPDMLGGALTAAGKKAQIPGIGKGMGAPSVQPGITGGGPGSPYETVPMNPATMRTKTPQVSQGIIGEAATPQRFGLGGSIMGGGGIGQSPDRYGNPMGGMPGMGQPSPDFWQQLMQSMAGRRIGGF